MPIHAVWVHGNAVRAQWVGDPPLPEAQGTRLDGTTGGVPHSNIVGLPEGPGATYRGRTPVGFGGARAVPVRSAFFHFSIPTPVLLNNARARLVRAFVLYRTDVDFGVQEVHLFDGPNYILGPPMAGRPRRDTSGTNGLSDLIAGVTSFEVPGRPPMIWGLGISVGVAFPGIRDRSRSRRQEQTSRPDPHRKPAISAG
ncbi:MAG: hypothetical protein ABR613_12005 [Actinomycetota bacterium]